jgi:TonB-linked SusC/RagA family outer membrane protein
MYQFYHTNLNKWLMRLNLICVLLLLAFLQVAIAAKAQKISLSKKNAALTDIFTEIRQQSGYDFLYPKDLLKQAKKISIELTNASLTTVLNSCFKDQPFTYTVSNKTVIIKEKEQSILDRVMEYIKAIAIKGKIIDEKGLPIPGATVQVKSTGKTVIANAEGQFSLNAEENDIITVSYIGYKKQEITLRKAGDLTIRLEQEIANLDQVQVMGYGTTTKRLSTGTISSITSAEIEKVPAGNVLSVLAGRMAGVEVLQSSGMPGGTVGIKIRGDNTFGALGNSSSAPLFVIDGIPIASGDRATFQNTTIRGASGAVNAFSMINPDDIEQIDVLKDADATAIYGARGANGVVMITTKKGRAGQIRFNADVSAGSAKVGRFIKLLNTQQYLELRKEAFKNEDIEPDADNAPDLINWDQQAYTDFQRLILGGTPGTGNASLSASGGTDLINYYAAVNYRKEGTVLAKDQYVQRFGSRINLNMTSPDRKFNALIASNYSTENSSLSRNEDISGIYLPPNFPLYNTDGTLHWENELENPLASLLSKYRGTNMLFTGNLNLSYKPIQGLTLKTVMGYTLNRLENQYSEPANSVNPIQGATNSAAFANVPITTYTIEPQAEYVFNAAGGKITALLGGTYNDAVSESTTIRGSNYAYASQLNSIAGAGILGTEYSYAQYRYASVFGRLNYDLKDRYLFSATYRQDASSRFGTNNRLAAFASFGASWIFSEEALIKKNLSFLSFGKLKMSYGSTGNDKIDNYQYYLKYVNTANIYQNTSPLTPGSYSANPNLKWESTHKAEIALNLGFLKDRILFSVNAYRNRSSNLINILNISGQSGFSYLVTNLDALVQNKGLELELNTRNVESQHFSWNTAFNISFQRNNLLKFNQLNQIYWARYFRVGAPIDSYNYIFLKFDGIDPETGKVKYEDNDGVPGINTSTDSKLAPLGTPFYGGLTNSFKYKDLSLDFSFQFVNKQGQRDSYQGYVGGLSNQNLSVLDRWQKSGDQNKRWPAASSGLGDLSSNYDNLYYSDAFYGNAGFIKLKSASLSYNLPGTWIRKARLQHVRLNLQGFNLLTFSRQKNLLDPDYSSNLIPQLRTFMAGINCSF